MKPKGLEKAVNTAGKRKSKDLANKLKVFLGAAAEPEQAPSFLQQEVGMVWSAGSPPDTGSTLPHPCTHTSSSPES